MFGEIQTKYFQEHKRDTFTDIRNMVKQDAMNKRRVCAKYLGSINPWLPVKPGLDVYNYFMDKSKKLGWCVNPKVSTHSNLNIQWHKQFTICLF